MQARQNQHMIKLLIHGLQDSLYSTFLVNQINNVAQQNVKNLRP